VLGLGRKQFWKYPRRDVRGHASPSITWFVPVASHLVTQKGRHLSGNLIFTLPLSVFGIRMLPQTCICFPFQFLAFASRLPPPPICSIFWTEAFSRGQPGLLASRHACPAPGCAGSHRSHTLSPASWPSLGPSLPVRSPNPPDPSARMNLGSEF